MIPQYRDLWRFRAPLSAGEIRRTERWLATARVALTIAGGSHSLDGASARLCAFALAVLAADGVLRARRGGDVAGALPAAVDQAFRLVVHAADIVWPVLIYLFATAQRGPFVLFFVFVMAAAAYRWGLWETVGTAVPVALLGPKRSWCERTGVAADLAAWLASAAAGCERAHELDPQQLVMFSVYLIVLGFLLGYMSENQKKVRAERAVITRVLSSTRVEAGLTGTMQQILGEVMSIYGARRVLSASQEAHSYRVFLAEMNRGAESPETLRWREACRNAKRRISSTRPRTRFTPRARQGFSAPCCSIATEGGCAMGARNFWMRWRPWKSLTRGFGGAGCSATEWSGRVFLFDPADDGRSGRGIAVSCRNLRSRWLRRSTTCT
jgi:hypothetical protein